jgi:hypothetical protein
LDQKKFEEPNCSSKTSIMGDSIVYCYLEDIQDMPKKTSRHMDPGSLDYASRTSEFLLSDCYQLWVAEWSEYGWASDNHQLNPNKFVKLRIQLMVK